MSAEDVSEVKAKSGNSRLRQERERRGWTQSEVAERLRTTRINVGRWENGQTFPSPYYRQRLAELFGKSLQELDLLPEGAEERDEASIPLAETNLQIAPPVWNVPYQKNPFFTGRDTILSYLHTVLSNKSAAALTQAQAISGLGGIGKTQIAIEYAYRYRDDYQAIFWINASTREVLRADYVALATLLDLPEQHEQDQDITIRAVRRWLDTSTRWLLILDNVDRPEIIVDYLPLHPRGDILLTTRLHALGKVAHCVEVEKMGQPESTLLLLRRARLLDPHTSLELAGDEEKTLATEIVTELDGLPLALDQAGAYIEETHCGLPQYLDLYGTRRQELLLRRGTFSLDHPDSVVATWLLSFAHIQEENPAAADLLRLLTFLYPEDIPDELITSSATERGDALDAIASDRFLLNAAIELVLRYSLIRRNPKAMSLSIHRLVQAVLKDSMNRDTQYAWAERVIRAVDKAFPAIIKEQKNWDKCQRYLPHVYVCAEHIDEYALALPEAARLLNDAAEYLVIHAQYQQAEALLQKALMLRRQILEDNHPDLIRTLNNLGLLYRKTGEFSRGEQFLLEALDKQEQALGQYHIDVAQTQYNLGRLYRAQGSYLKAKPFYWQALHTRERLLGDNDLLVAQSYYGLAKLYNSLEQFQQAEEFCGKALRIQEQLEEKNDLMIASILDILAKIYTRQRKLDQAMEVNERALYIREGILGEEHPQVAIILNNLVEIYHAQGRYKEAAVLLDKALRIDEKAFGFAHPNIAYSFYNLAENFSLGKNHEKAELYYKKALAIREKVLGDHPRTALIYFQLAKYYACNGSYEEAESLYLKALSIRERAFGPDHAIVASTLEQYALLLRKLKREREACEVENRIRSV